ncbi:ExeM/NucH family extracellular endonuclease [Aliikangiella coralliicola]|uniref:ExeM/NucH family extracellular endonuclease n=1 Tax=Aliikangiella coralliicola TaxID=2592383 RepID=A0A545UAQ0_9GAMM|nr:ExeM/NucH family extracellular endonuclease [Aliikangiella coralliicola]TQV86552.1 ExeM/NucH family extracellular endonuclease [Aliikangiella coralliicola]
MKQKILATTLLSIMGTSLVNAAPSGLFISEYIEGSSNNKALEIANTSESNIDLSEYQLKMYFNGNSSAGLTINLEGNVQPGQVHVIAHARANDEILNVANQTQGSGWFNGDDAIVLLKNNTIVDSIGQIGFDPGSEWGQDLQSTKDNTLRRNLNIENGDTDPNNAFFPADEWSGYAKDSFDDLGKIDSVEPPVEFSCNEPAEFIHNIQGTGTSTPMQGQAIEVEAIVVGDFQQSDQLRGFFLQEEDSDQDNNAQTSEGIFVYDNGFGTDVKLGDKVRVAGYASEYGGTTQISSVSQLAICANNQDVTPAIVHLPFTSAEQAEQFEGMSIIIEQTLTVSENYNLARYGELVLSNGRLFNPTNIVSPGDEANSMQAKNDLNRIILDDGSTRQNPAEIGFPQPGLSAYNTVRGGDTLSLLHGVMHQAFGSYRVQPTAEPDFHSNNMRTYRPEIEDSPLYIASFNVLNYFNGDGLGGEFPTARGADTPAEFERQRNKIINAIAAMDADIIGLMEIENDGYDGNSAIADLVNGLNNATGKNYTFVQPGDELPGSDQIAVGIIYNQDKIDTAGTAATLSTGAFSDKNRQPLVQSFREIESNGEFTVVVNHFKSKGSCPSDTTDINAAQGDGQGCWNSIRTEASQELASWLDTNPTGLKDKDILIIGDLNAYAMEDPVTTLEAMGYENLLKKYSGELNYSYVFYGQAGTLDHALSNSQLASQIIDTTEWHINTDEPRALDYNLEYKTSEQQLSLYSEEPFRASDHDPIVIGLNLKPKTDINNDGRLNFRDIFAVIRHMRQAATGKNRRYDLNQDHRINFKDVRIVIRAIFKARGHRRLH